MDVLDWISFGKVSAERDENLDDYFFDNGTLRSLVDNRHEFLVLGRKGAGKTAVFRHFAARHAHYCQPGSSFVGLSLEDYNWNIHKLLANKSAAESLAYKQSWKFVILVEAIKAACSYFEVQKKPLPPSLKKSQDLLHRLFENPLPTLGEIVSRKLLRLSKLKFPKAGLGLDEGAFDGIEFGGGEVSFEDVQGDPSLQEIISNNLSHIISHLEVAARAIPSDCCVFVCFDRVDEAWDDISFESSRRVIAGLVSAADSISSDFKDRIRPIVFLREDIFEVLSLNDANKLREDCGELLSWDRDSLWKLILVRVNFFGKAHGIPSVTDVAELFDRAEMRQRAKPSNYILRRSMMRPRDLVAFLNRVVSTMKEQRDDPFQEEVLHFETLSVDSLYAAESGYSEWLLNELIDEWGTQRPEVKRLLSGIQATGTTSFSHDVLAQKLNLDADSSEYLDQLKLLYNMSAIGFPRARGPAIDYIFRCFLPSQGFVRSDEYKVHDGLVRALNLVETRERETK